MVHFFFKPIFSLKISLMERQRRQRLANVELDDTLDHHIWNGLDTMQYKVILVDCIDIAKIVFKKSTP